MPKASSPAPGPAPWTRLEAAAVALVVALAIGLRVLHVLGSRASPLFEAPQMDALYHLEWARALAAGEPFQPPPFFRAPLYPWFLGSLLRLLGEDLLALRLVQAGLGGLTTLLVVLTARRACGRPEALVAGALWATHWVGIFFDGELLLETLAVPLYMLGLWLSLGLARRLTPARCVLVGLVWGLSAITRPNVLLFMPLLALWVFLRQDAPAVRRLLAPLGLTVGTLLPILPLSAYNALAGGDAVLISSEAGMCLWIGNNPDSDGSTAIVPGTRADWWGGYHDAIAQAERAEGRSLRPSGVSRHYARRTLASVTAHPGAWLRLMAHKLRLLTWDQELGNNEEPRFLFERFSPLRPLAPLGFVVLFPLALLGLAVTWRGAWERLPLWGFLLAYSASVVLFFVNSRFRLPLLPVGAVYAGASTLWLVRTARARRWPRLGAGLLTVLAAALLTQAYPRSVQLRARSNGHLILGSAAARAGDPAGARPELERAVELTPGSHIAWRALGDVRRALSDPDGAERAYRRALDLRPDDADTLDLLADLLLAQGRAPEALQLGRRLHAVEPATARGAYVEGRAHFAAADMLAAQRAFRRALDLEPAHFAARYSLGIALEQAGQRQSAAEELERALETAPADDSRRAYALDAWRRAVELWLALGQSPRARQLYEHWRARFAGEPAERELRRRL